MCILEGYICTKINNTVMLNINNIVIVVWLGIFCTKIYLYESLNFYEIKFVIIIL